MEQSTTKPTGLHKGIIDPELVHVVVPYAAKSPDTATCQESIEYAAKQCGVNKYLVGLIITYYFERVAYHLGKNRRVRIPGFGLLFAAIAATKNPHIFPAFQGCGPLRRYLRYRIPLSQSKTIKEMRLPSEAYRLTCSAPITRPYGETFKIFRSTMRVRLNRETL